MLGFDIWFRVVFGSDFLGFNSIVFFVMVFFSSFFFRFIFLWVWVGEVGVGIEIRC